MLQGKRWLFYSVTLVLLLAIVIGAGCAQPAPPTSTSPAPVSPTTGPITPTPMATTPVAPPTQAKVFKWKMQTITPVGDTFWTSTKLFADQVRKRTNGQIDITVYGAGDLVPVAGLLEAVSKGVVDAQWNCSIYNRGAFPESEAEQCLPFGSPNGFVVWDLWYNRGMLDLYRQIYARDFNAYYLCDLDSGGYAFVSKKPIRTVADLKGKTVRVSGLHLDMLTELGAKGVWMSVGELYTALATGTLDSCIISIGAQMSAKHYEVAPYIILPPINKVIGCNFAINMDRWKELSPELKNIVEWCGSEAQIYWATKYEESYDRMAADYVRLGKGEAIYWSDADVNTAKAAARTAWTKYAATNARAAVVIKSMEQQLIELGYMKAS